MVGFQTFSAKQQNPGTLVKSVKSQSFERCPQLALNVPFTLPSSLVYTPDFKKKEKRPCITQAH